MSFTYEYDEANQLVRENLYYGFGNANNATYTYEYDDWGNILKKKKYAYTTDTLGAVVETIAYGYNDSQWGDRLTSFNSQTITYDAMGNPESYLGKTLSWEGKQLVSAERTIGSITSTYSFSYDENGLRTRKTFTASFGGNSASVHTDYYYNGSVLIGMKSGSKLMRFSYDAGGNVVSVDHSTDNGSTYETYYYLRNAQGDIVKLIDENGAAVVEYLYDSWGKAISVMGTLATTLGTDQPFRYRGYVYDEETCWYYLQSRYYDPTTCRFISADVLLSTGQGVIGHNSFAYCLNMPTNGSDSNGHVFRPYSVQMSDNGSGNGGYYAGEIIRKRQQKKKPRKFFKLFKTIKAVNQKIFGNKTFQHGVGGSAAFGAQGSLGFGYAIDSSGNFGFYFSHGLGSGSPSLGAYDIQTITTGCTLESLEGMSFPIGGSANVYEFITAGGEFSCGRNEQTNEAMFCFSACGGVSAKLPVNAEIHGGTQYTKVIWSTNVLDWLSNLFGE